MWAKQRPPGGPSRNPACLSTGAGLLAGGCPESQEIPTPGCVTYLPLVLDHVLQVRGGPQKGLLAFSLHGTDGKSGNPLKPSLIPELRRRREKMGLPELWVCPDFSYDVSLSPTPQAGPQSSVRHLSQ